MVLAAKARKALMEFNIALDDLHDPLFAGLIEQVEKCSGPAGCDNCPMKNKCQGLWDQAVSRINGGMKIDDFLYYYNEFKNMEGQK
ncbi:MAG: hypothetical protein QQM50_01715 [Dehalococcoides mccartyi]|jgi:hypothetical protein|uniref:Uncharacterized protein n=3 Tax=root TaxID=1 RepID=A0A142VD87_9CHLR|nr:MULTISPECIES: hypothetical protein [Dehalococcoides]AAW39062.1 hypothetical protein DET0077 [Dehalococcoides mccartyi 195]AGG07297.1 hypothetical protein btf_188 [Dehalococcoides mccartyi BTF08]AMU87175.1 hypothetical protein Dm11a5_1349 [Dehalococcoides mccartyi]AQU02581.1 hypothetical protein B1773_00515 [Dehalococcoides mccartyi]AQU03917.1 hypothetical protein B1774_00375 [Dehalococcoides mccartyi]